MAEDKYQRYRRRQSERGLVQIQTYVPADEKDRVLEFCRILSQQFKERRRRDDRIISGT